MKSAIFSACSRRSGHLRHCCSPMHAACCSCRLHAWRPRSPYREEIAGTPALWTCSRSACGWTRCCSATSCSPRASRWRCWPARRWRDGLVAAYFAAWAFVLVYLELATPPFIAEYGKPPRSGLLEYLVVPARGTATLWANHKLGLVGVPLVAALAAWLAWRASLIALAAAPTWAGSRRVLMLPLVARRAVRRLSFQPGAATGQHQYGELQRQPARERAHDELDLHGWAMPWRACATRRTRPRCTATCRGPRCSRGCSATCTCRTARSPMRRRRSSIAKPRSCRPERPTS